MALNAGDILFKLSLDDKEFRQGLQTAGKAIGVSMTAAGAAITAAVGFIGKSAIESAGDVNTASQKMVSAFGLPESEAAKFADTIRKVYGDNFGDSLSGVGEAVQTVYGNLKGLGSVGSEQLALITESAIAISDAFGVDVADSTMAVNSLMRDFGVSAGDAFDMVTWGLQNGLNSSGDFLDSITEYSTQFANGGASAEQFFSLMKTGMADGMLGTDKAADAFKEFRVRILDGSKSTTESLAMIGLSAEDITAKINSGQMSIADAFNLVLSGLRNTNDQAVLMQAGVGLIGTQFEDLGQSIATGMNLGSVSIMDMASATESLSTQYETLGNDWEGIKRKLVLAGESIGQALLPVLGQILDIMAPIIDQFSNWVRANPQVAASVIAVAGAIGGLMATIGPLLVMLPSLSAAWGAVTTAVGAVVAAFGAIAAAISAPVAVVIAAIGAIALAGAALYNYWEEIKTALTTVWNGIKEAFFIAWGPIIDTIKWLADVGMGVIDRVGSFFGASGTGALNQDAVNRYQQQGGSIDMATAAGNPRGGNAGMGGGGGVNIQNITIVSNDPREASRNLAQSIALELSAAGVPL